MCLCTAGYEDDNSSLLFEDGNDDWGNAHLLNRYHLSDQKDKSLQHMRLGPTVDFEARRLRRDQLLSASQLCDALRLLITRSATSDSVSHMLFLLSFSLII